MKKIYACAFLVLILSVLNSCKKDILTPGTKEIDRSNGIKKDYIKLEKVNYELFIKELGTKSPTGLTEFNKGKKFKGQVSFSTSSESSIILETDSISKIQNQDHTTFTIPVKLASKYAVNFQNFIIDIDKGKTTSFLITYFPDKAYKQKIHEGKKPFFTGKIIRSAFNLSNASIGTLANPSGPATVSGVVCTTTTYISGIVEVQCSGDGHWVGEACSPDVASPAHYEYTYSTSLDCVYEDNGGGGNGDGAPAGPPSTTPVTPNLSLAPVTAIIYPTPPANYEPCIAGPDSGDGNGINPGGPAANVCDPYTPIPYSSLTLSLQGILLLDDDQAALIDANPLVAEEINDFIENNRLNGAVSQALLDKIKETINGMLSGMAVFADPANNPSSESNDFTTINFDNNDYGAYQQNDAWPTINSVIPKELWVKHRRDAFGESINCLVLAREQLGVLGYDASGYDAAGQTFKINTQDGINKPETAKAVNYIKSKLQAGIPVLVGVDYAPGSVNLDGKADHFVVITGMFQNGGTKYFTFFDSGSYYPWEGASNRNLLIYDEALGIIKGISKVDFGSLYRPLYRNTAKEVIFTVTHVRKTKTK